MNVDYVLENTPALSRKLTRLAKMIKLNIDPVLLEKAGDDLLTLDDVRSRIPVPLHKHLNEKVLGIIQYGIDYDLRFILGTRTFAQSAAFSLMTALGAGEKVIVVTDKQDYWYSFLKNYDIKYTHVIKEDQEIDYTCDILVVNHKRMVPQIVNKTRDRVILTASSIIETAYTFDSIFGLNYDIDAYVGEYPKAIGSFYGNTTSPKGDIRWWETSPVINLINGFYPDIQTTKVFTTLNFNQAGIQKQGFLLSSPNHMARIMGIHVDLHLFGLDGQQDIGV